MHMLIDPDEYEVVWESRPCSACGGDLRKCNGACNGMASWGWRRRSDADIRRIKAERQAAHEAAVLAEAAAIMARLDRKSREPKDTAP